LGCSRAQPLPLATSSWAFSAGCSSDRHIFSLDVACPVCPVCTVDVGTFDIAEEAGPSTLYLI
jgi:hypothetical protein